LRVGDARRFAPGRRAVDWFPVVAERSGLCLSRLRRPRGAVRAARRRAGDAPRWAAGAPHDESHMFAAGST